MIYFYILIFFATLMMLTKLSILNFKESLLAIFICYLIILLVSFFIQHISAKELYSLIYNQELLIFLCAFQVIESFLQTFVSLNLIKEKHGRKEKIYNSLVLFSWNIFSIIGTIFALSFSFNHFAGTNYLITTIFFIIIFSLIYLMLISINNLLFSKLIKQENILLISIIQLIMAIFIPILLRGTKMISSQFQTNILDTIIVFSLITFFCILGFIKRYLNIRRKKWSY
jgi:hypothetical protein